MHHPPISTLTPQRFQDLLAAEEKLRSLTQANIDPKAQLCYIEDNSAYFTTDFKNQWGDDWDDAPYEHNAELPYNWYPDSTKPEWKVYKCYWDGPFKTPAEMFGMNSPYSVESINQHAIAWLTPKGDFRPILAGCTFEEFCRLIWAAGGDVYVKHSQA